MKQSRSRKEKPIKETSVKEASVKESSIKKVSGKEKSEEEKKNPLHREYGVWSNLGFIIKNMIRYEKFLLVLVPLGIVLAPIMQYLWTFLTKFVIDMITGEAKTTELLGLVALFAFIQIVSTMANTFFYSENWWRYISVRFHMMTDKNIKIMTVGNVYVPFGQVHTNLLFHKKKPLFPVAFPNILYSAYSIINLPNKNSYYYGLNINKYPGNKQAL